MRDTDLTQLFASEDRHYLLSSALSSSLPLCAP